MTQLILAREDLEMIAEQCEYEQPVESFTSRERLLHIEQLSVYVQHKKKIRWPLVQGVSFSVYKGETLALVGESGSGKSVTASAIAGLLPDALTIHSGRIEYNSEDILGWTSRRRKGLRGKKIGWISQNYQDSFTPFIKIGRQLVETLRTHRKLSRREAKELAMYWLAEVALPAERVFGSYPFLLSGGQLQRAALAAALMLEPEMLIADEPTTALDVLTGNRVLDLMNMLQKQTGCAVLLISHDLRQVMKRADRIAVMNEGQIVEMEDAATIRDHAKHPYTQMLLDACPSLT